MRRSQDSAPPTVPKLARAANRERHRTAPHKPGTDARRTSRPAPVAVDQNPYVALTYHSPPLKPNGEDSGYFAPRNVSVLLVSRSG